MIKGLRYQIPNEWGCFLRHIFDEIPVETYNWHLQESDVYLKSNVDEFLFEFDVYNGASFKNLIECQKEYLIVFLGLIAFPSKSNETVTNYQSFLHSSASFSIKVVDCVFVDIYVKEQERLYQFRKAAEKHGFQKIEIITEENDYFKSDWIT